MTRGSPLFTASGKARFVPTGLAVLMLSTLAAVRSPWGFLQYQSKELLTVMVPIAGTVLALALPAAQLAQSVVESFLSSVGELAKKPPDKLLQFFSNLAVQRRRDLASMYCVIVYSLCSFLLGAAGFLGLFADVKVSGVLSARDWIACTAVGFLIASVLWFMPVVRSSFNTTKLDEIVQMLREAARPPAAQGAGERHTAPAAAGPEAPVAKQ